MPARDTTPTGAPCWVNLMTSDPARSRDFYGQLFGWTASEPQEQFGGYFNFSKDGVLVAGGMPKQPGMDAPDTWSVYLATDDAQKTIEAAAAHGGQVLVPAMQVADLGTMAMVTDAGGAAIGMWQPGLHRASGSWPRMAPPAGSRCTPATTRPPSRSTATCSAGIRRPWATRPSSVTRSPSTARTRWPESWTARDSSRGRPGPLGGLLRHRGRRRRPGQHHPPGRLGHQARGGHPLRPAGRGGRPDRRPFQARGPERGHAREVTAGRHGTGPSGVAHRLRRPFHCACRTR